MAVLSSRLPRLPLILALSALASGLDVGCAAHRPPAPVPAALGSSAAAAPSGPTAAGGVNDAAGPLAARLPHSIDLTAIDRTVRPGADFFLFANGSWLAKAQIPADRSSAGVFRRVGDEVERRTASLLENASRSPDPETKKIGDYYAAYMDEAGIEARGTQPLAAALARIAGLTDARALASLLGAQLRADVDPLNNSNFHTDHVLGLWVEQDLNDSSRYAAYLLQGGLGMPDRSYYLDPSPEKAALRTAYVHHLAAMLRLGGVADADAKAARVFALETRIAQVHATQVDSEDVAKANNVWSRADFATRAPGMAWDAFFAAASLANQSSFIVWQPKAVAGIAALVRSQPLATWKDYLTARAIDHSATYLPKALLDEHFAFYEKTLQGVSEIPARWKLAVQETNGALGEAVGKAYVAKYFPPESKRVINKMVTEIEAAFARRIDALGWMSPATKAKAKEKLAGLYVGIGYPDQWHDNSALAVSRDDAFGNFERAELFAYRRSLGKLGQPVERGEWAMVPQIVNAVNMPVRNAICFPAGILVAPYFDPDASAASNFGGIGAIIGHEISHSFDVDGAHFDAKGRYANWWTPADLAHFRASGAALAAQFSRYQALPNAAIDGKLTLNENIADLAGLAAAYDAWQSSLDGRPAPEVDGLTGPQQFFLSYAQSWQQTQREASLRASLATNPHAPPHYRVWTVRNLDPWYAAFDVTPADAMYLAPKERVVVW